MNTYPAPFVEDIPDRVYNTPPNVSQDVLIKRTCTDAFVDTLPGLIARQLVLETVMRWRYPLVKGTLQHTVVFGNKDDFVQPLDAYLLELFGVRGFTRAAAEAAQADVDAQNYLDEGSRAWGTAREQHAYVDNKIRLILTKMTNKPTLSEYR